MIHLQFAVGMVSGTSTNIMSHGGSVKALPVTVTTRTLTVRSGADSDCDTNLSIVGSIV